MIKLGLDKAILEKNMIKFGVPLFGGSLETID